MERSPNRKLSEITTEELEAAAREALERLREEDPALVRDTTSKAVH